MKTWILPCLLFLCSSVVAQQPVYQLFDVDSTAQPRGGIGYLTAFLQTNLRKPVLAEAKGIGGRVIVSAIVETDGRVTGVKVNQSKSPELMPEAGRVFSLFNAWQPAQKAGQAVRQQVSFPVTFKPNTPFIYANGARISYFDTNRIPLADSSEVVRFKQVSPMDTTGLPTGDIVVYKANGTSWQEEYRLRFTRIKSSQRSGRAGQVYVVGYQNNDRQWEGIVVNVDEAGVLVSRDEYESGRATGSSLTYHPNGTVAEAAEVVDGKKVLTSWYPNGQIKQVWTVGSVPLAANTPEQVTAHWDSTGRLLVDKGNGRAFYAEIVPSLADTTRLTRYEEQGTYENGLKQGIWTGRYADGSFFYEERYDKGVCQGGKSITAGGDTVRYTVRDQQPEFIGGFEGLSRFLAQTVRYPAEAYRARAQGRVFVSFVVCTDGTLCDYKVLKGVDPSLDQEAVRVVKAMDGRWKPGSQRGRKVRVKYNLPINFTL